MADQRERSSLEGQLNAFQLAELVQAMGIDGSSGALRLFNGDGREGVVYFEHGALAWCREQHRDALTLGKILQQLNMADSETIEHYHALMVNDPLGDLLGQQLVEARAISSDQLNEALRHQMIWTVREMSLWTDGTYSFMRDAASPLRSTRSSPTQPARFEAQPVEASRVAMEIVRYQYEWNELRQWLPGGMYTELRMAVEPPLDNPLIFPAPVWRVITRVNAFQTPRAIATALRQPEMEIARILAPLVREALLYARVGEYSIGLPIVARSPGTQNVDFFALISRMLQEWIRRKTLVEQLAGLAVFINWTMDEIAQAWEQNNRVPASDSLSNLLRREQCHVVAGYTLRVVDNHIDVDDLTKHLRFLAESARKQNTLHEFVDEVFGRLSLALSSAFVAINRRIDSPEHRKQYELTWTDMFKEFHEQLNLR